ncbi:MAG: hypothetical protein ACYC46_16175 [Acidobacteriaceae bacterium]
MRFVDDSGEDVVTAWLAGCRLPKLAKAIKTKLDVVVTFLENSEYITPSSYAKPLRGYADIFEIVLQVKGDPYRPLCCHGPGNHEITILVMAIERGDKFEPTNAPEVALARKTLIHSADRRYVCGYRS